MKPVFESVVVLVFLVDLFSSTVLAREDWTPEFLSQTRTKRCILGKIERDVTFLHGTDSGDFQKLGKVADMEVCVLLCCEMEHCEAAFMADRNCYAVKCHSQEHCVTAPARKNKWRPSVVFVKRISQSNKDQDSLSAHGQSKQHGAPKDDVQKGTSAVHKDVKFQVEQSKDERKPEESLTTHAQNKQSGISGEHTQKKTSAVQRDDKLFQVDESTVKEGQTAQTLNKLRKPSKEPAQKETTAVQGFKDSEIPTRSDQENSNGKLSSLVIPVQGKPAVVRLDEEETKRKTLPLDKRKMAIRQEMFNKSKYSLVSAAVLTCSMAVVLSTVAVIAARIRKKHEVSQDPEYSSVPTAQE